MGNICDIKKIFSLSSENYSGFDQIKDKKNGIEGITTKNSSDKKKSLDDYDIMRILGRGAFGMVMLCKEKYSKKLFAIKMIPKKKLIKEKISKDQAITEKKILAEANSLRIVKMYFSFQDKNYLYFVLEYLSGGSLQNYITSPEARKPSRVLFYAIQILEGIRYLHTEKKIIYRDLKPENILLTENGHAKLCDFGLSKYGLTGMTFCGTPEYIAPEIIQSKL